MFRYRCKQSGRYVIRLFRLTLTSSYFKSIALRKWLLTSNWDIAKQVALWFKSAQVFITDMISYFLTQLWLIVVESWNEVMQVILADVTSCKWTESLNVYIHSHLHSTSRWKNNLILMIFIVWYNLYLN